MQAHDKAGGEATLKGMHDGTCVQCVHSWLALSEAVCIANNYQAICRRASVDTMEHSWGGGNKWYAALDSQEVHLNEAICTASDKHLAIRRKLRAFRMALLAKLDGAV